MKAMISSEAGSAASLFLGDLPDPTPSSGEVMLRVHACGINFPDTLIIEDKYQVRPLRPFAPGAEVAGVVLAIGDGVTGLEPGDRVIGIGTHGGLAEKLLLPASECTPIPDNMPWDTAAALIFTYGTSIHALHDRAVVKSGETVLVLGAAGGVGLAAVQLAKAAGAKVIAAVSSEEKAALAKAAGADEALVYPTSLDRESSRALATQIKAALGKGGADVVVDTVGGDYSEAALRSIAWNGRYLIIGFPAGIPKIAANLVLLKACQVIGVFWGPFMQNNPGQNHKNNLELIRLWQSGKIAPRITARYPLEKSAQAIADLAERRAQGKIVVEIA